MAQDHQFLTLCRPLTNRTVYHVAPVREIYTISPNLRDLIGLDAARVVRKHLVSLIDVHLGALFATRPVGLATRFGIWYFKEMEAVILLVLKGPTQLRSMALICVLFVKLRPVDTSTM